VKWLDLPDDVFTGLRRVIRDLQGLGTDSPRQPAPGAGTSTVEEGA